MEIPAAVCIFPLCKPYFIPGNFLILHSYFCIILQFRFLQIRKAVPADALVLVQNHIVSVAAEQAGRFIFLQNHS